MMKYQEIFLKVMKLLLLYFMRFKKDSKIFTKKYLIDYTIRKLNWQQIIIIIYNKRIFSTNNDW